VETTKKYLEKSRLLIYPFGTYPGKFQPETNKGPTYELKSRIFGDRWHIAQKVAGFHHHYALPKGVFDSKKKELKLLQNSKLKSSMINSYNFEIATDPITTLFTQSSPFFDGVNLAKDCRMIVYRGGKKLKYPKGMYGKYRSLGHLPPYPQTLTDLILSINQIVIPD